MFRKFFHLALMSILLACPLFSENSTKDKEDEQGSAQIRHEITVTATRIDTPAREVATSVTVITREDIERSQKTTALEILQTVPGLVLIQNGPAGAAASVLIRGGNAEHTLVMMDGVEINDPITPSRSVDLAHLSLDNVERIEILRGPQSTLYGSDALSGVIHIITRKGEDKSSVEFSTRGGSYGTIGGNAALSGSKGKIFYSLGASYSQTEGFSAASDSYEGNSEKDGYQNFTFSGRLAFRLSDAAEFDLVVRRVDTAIDIDNFGGAFGDDPNNQQSYDSLFVKGQARLSFWNNRWEQKFNLAFIDYDRIYENSTDSLHPFDREDASYQSRLFQIDWQHNLYIHETNTLTFGMAFQQEQGESTYVSEGQWGPYESVFPLRTGRTTGLYLQDQIRFSGRFFAALGVRLDSHSQFGTSLTYRLAPAYFFEKTGTKIKATIGTGFKSPSLYQLHAPGTFWGPIGNADLEPEKSTGWDAGIEQHFLQGRIRFSATYFSQLYTDLIDFDVSLGFINIAEARSRGLELLFDASLLEALSFSAGYTRLKARDAETGESLLRRPRDQFQATVKFRAMKRVNMDFSLVKIGERDDIQYTAMASQRIRMPSFTLINAAASYEASSYARIYLRIDNIFNTRYEMINGYGTPGFSLYGGVHIHF